MIIQQGGGDDSETSAGPVPSLVIQQGGGDDSETSAVPSVVIQQGGGDDSETSSGPGPSVVIQQGGGDDSGGDDSETSAVPSVVTQQGGVDDSETSAGPGPLVVIQQGGGDDSETSAGPGPLVVIQQGDGCNGEQADSLTSMIMEACFLCVVNDDDLLPDANLEFSEATAVVDDSSTVVVNDVAEFSTINLNDADFGSSSELHSNVDVTNHSVLTTPTDVSSNTDVSTKTRKRSVRTRCWKRHLTKQARQSGKEYVNRAGRVVPRKEACTEGSLCTCRRKCSDKVTLEQRTKIFDAFYMLDENGKNVYMFGCMKAKQPKLMVCGAKRHRTVSFWYTVTVDNSDVRVCRRAFMSLHGVTSSKVAHVGSQLSAGQSAPHPSQRGKHSRRPNRLTCEAVQQVKEHISMFPADESHYSRSVNTGKKYLSPILNISIMYKLYQKWCEEQSAKPVSARSYRTIFNEKFNLSFGHPKSDTCNVCDAGGDDAHCKRAEDAFRAMKQDRMAAQQMDDINFITFDMQKTLPLPKLSTNVAFYLRQLWLYNVGVHHISKDNSQAYFNIWTENESGRGSQEVGSAILAFLDNAKINGGRLIAWSDSCAGQNKNWNIICLWQYLIASGRVSQIDHKFPESGHSFLDSDRDFANIERRVRVHKDIYCVDEYHSIMAQSQSKCPPHVCRIGSRIYDLKELTLKLGLVNRNVNASGEKVLFKQSVRWIRVSQFGCYQYKTSHEESAEWMTVNLLKHGCTSVPECDAILALRCQKQSAVKPAKVADLRKQLVFIPVGHREFYQQIVDDASDAAHHVDDSCHEDDILIDEVYCAQFSHTVNIGLL